MNPQKRIERLENFNQRLKRTQESMRVLDEWNLELESKLVKFKGSQIDAQELMIGNGAQ